MRKTILPLVAGALVVVGLQPAAAATTPAQVGLVSFVAASYSRTYDTAGFTLDWARVSGARTYQVFMSRSYEMTRPKVFRTSSSSITVTKLTPGRDYFFQVRGVNGTKTGAKSSRSGHTTTVHPGPTGRLLPLRVMTYNVCSSVCDDNGSTPYPWEQSSANQRTPRQPVAFKRIAAASPDILATQEAGRMDTPPGYTLARYISAKRLFFKSSRFVLAPGTKTALPPKDKNGCVSNSAYTDATGHIFLGRHSAGCRYAVWAKLVDVNAKKTVLAVDVHHVTGDSAGAVANREEEVNALFEAVNRINTTDLPVVFAGDFNSHKNRTPDVVAPVMKREGFRDAFDLARSLSRQHYNSFNGFDTRPRIGVKWGDHVDHVFVDPTRTRVDRWYNAVLIKDGRLVKPIPSDHSPLVIDLQVK